MNIGATKMNDLQGIALPPSYTRILTRSQELGFSMNSDVLTGSLLRTLAASKPGGALLELGTGVGLGSAWLLDGMNETATLLSLENDAAAMSIAQTELGLDARATFILGDGAQFLLGCKDSFDLIYADTWPGKYSYLAEALRLVKRGGIFLVDDMLHQANWPDGHEQKAASLIATLTALEDFRVTKISWSSGLILCVKT